MPYNEFRSEVILLWRKTDTILCREIDNNAKKKRENFLNECLYKHTEKRRVFWCIRDPCDESIDKNLKEIGEPAVMTCQWSLIFTLCKMLSRPNFLWFLNFRFALFLSRGCNTLKQENNEPKKVKALLFN